MDAVRLDIAKLGAEFICKPESTSCNKQFCVNISSFNKFISKYNPLLLKGISFKNPSEFLRTSSEILDCDMKEYVKLYDWRIWIDVEDLTPPKEHDNLIISVATGKFEDLIRISEPSLKKYAKKCNADLIILKGKTQSYWGQEKFRIRNIAKNYKRTIFLDIDLIVSEQCPDLFQIIDEEKIGIYNDFEEMSKRKQSIEEALNWIQREKINLLQNYHKKYLSDPYMGYHKILNTGVVVFSNQHINIFEPITFPFYPTHCTEQTWIDFNIYKNNFEIQNLNKEFNTQYWMQDFFKEKYLGRVVHFSGCNDKKTEMANFKFIEHTSNNDDFVVITSHFNPMNYQLTIKNYWEWHKHISKFTKNIITAELSFNNIWNTQADIKIKGDKKLHSVFQKEAILNKIIKELPSYVKYVAWIDHDVIFNNQNWMFEAKEKLENGYSIVQLYDLWNFLDQNHNSIYQDKSSVFLKKKEFKDSGAPGGAFAGNVQFLKNHGLLYPYMITGGGDSCSLDGWLDRQSFPYDMFSNEMRNSLTDWKNLAKQDCSVDYISGELMHLYHGTPKNRDYELRRYILSTYDPHKDTIINSDGIVEWVNNFQVRDMILNYFDSRNEDK